MPRLTEAEQYLLTQIRTGSENAWSQLVDRYQGRLLAFARRRAPRGIDAEDLVQDTFLLFMRGLSNYRGDANIETFLFLILRRRIIETMRVKRLSLCQLPEDTGDSAAIAPAAPDLTASGYARQDEDRQSARAALAAALSEIVESLQADLNFRDLQILESLFYAQWPNRQIASALSINAEQIAMVKHRWLKQVRQCIGSEHDMPAAEAIDSLLTETWEDRRPSCPKRSTIGGYVLETLDDPWRGYVAFHIQTLGCGFCRANWEDLRKETERDAGKLRNRIMQSTVGFFRKA